MPSPEDKPCFRIAIQPDFLELPHGPESFSKRWAETLTEAGHEACPVDVFRADFFEQITGCDGFLWWFPPIPFPRDMARRLMLALGHTAQIPTFPDWKSGWHFDDKVAQNYLLQAAGLPIPRTWVFWQAKDALEFCRTAEYPLVIKLRSGVYSQNVQLLRNLEEAEFWVRQLFNYGLTNLDQPASAPLPRFAKRLRAAARELFRGHGPSIGGLDFHKDYLLVQEFVPGNDFDTRITVIGNRAFSFRRANRPQDFRASGSGILNYDRSLIEQDTIRLAFQVAASLSVQTICMDILRHAGKPVVCEVSYYFIGGGVSSCPGHWELEGDADTGQIEWVEGQMYAEDAILEDFLARLAGSAPQIVPGGIARPAGE